MIVHCGHGMPSASELVPRLMDSQKDFQEQLLAMCEGIVSGYLRNCVNPVAKS